MQNFSTPAFLWDEAQTPVPVKCARRSQHGIIIASKAIFLGLLSLILVACDQKAETAESRKQRALEAMKSQEVVSKSDSVKVNETGTLHKTGEAGEMTGFVMHEYSEVERSATDAQTAGPLILESPRATIRMSPEMKIDRSPARSPQLEIEAPQPDAIIISEMAVEMKSMRLEAKSAAGSTVLEGPSPESQGGNAGPPKDFSNPPVAPVPPPVATGKVRINFATDREWTQSTQRPKWFGDTRKDKKLEFHWGTCEVSIPIYVHKANEVEKPFSIFGITLPEDPKQHVIVGRPGLATHDRFFDKLQAEVRQRPEEDREVLIFIHGFNNTFEDAASRLAVLAYDMNFNGVSVLYSWASKGSWTPLGYKHDEVAVNVTVDRFTRFLQDVIDQTRAAGARRINIIGHSMGNRALVEALIRLAQKSSDEPLIDEVVMAAPDVPSYGFSDGKWAHMRGPFGHMTLYASANDRALEASQKFSSFPPLGLAGEALYFAEGLETIDASNVNFDFLGLNHTYLGGLIEDLKMLLHEGLRPPKRKLEEMKRDPWIFWVFPKIVLESR